MKKIILFAAVAIFIVSSCTIEKRLYNSGYHVEWNHSKKHVDSDQVAQEESASKVREVESVVVNKTANADQVVEETVVNNDAVVASEEASVSYDLAALTKTVSEKKVASAANETQMKASKATDAKKSEKSKAPEDGKSQIVALVLCILFITVGTLGIHRFYLGYTGIGILMLLTAGCCGILAIIDLIRIITGDLQPARGPYTKTF